MMEQPFSTSKVTVEYFDPHDVYKLISPGLSPRLPLRNLHWQSHSGPLRSIDVLWVELVNAGVATPRPTPGNLRRSVSASTHDDGFQTQQIGRHSASTDNIDTPTAAHATKERRHQIPGLRRTPYLKVLFVRCDDNDTYKSTTRAEIREWIKENTPPSTRKTNTQENHDAFEWLIVHVVVPNTVAATQPRVVGKAAEGASGEKAAASRWRTGSSTLLEKLRADFNVSGKGTVDRVAQIRIGINDVPYDMLPRVVPATPTGYSETEKDAENAWGELIAKLRSLILASFDMRVTQYEDDIREKDTQRALPGWNFCTFFILKEGLARGFESVGLVEDALVGYDELSVGLDTVLHEQVVSGEPERHGGALLSYTEEIKARAEYALSTMTGTGGGDDDEEAVDLQSKPSSNIISADDIPISSSRKLYRDMIVANNVSVFDFRSYIFSRQVSLLLRLGNAWSSKEQLLEKIKEQHDAVLHDAPSQGANANVSDEPENLAMLAEVCRRTLQFIPAISQIMRTDVLASLAKDATESQPISPQLAEVVDNLVASFAFSVAQQILAQTSTKALPIPPSLLVAPSPHEPKSSIPEPKTMMHPARNSSLNVRSSAQPPISPGIFPGPGAPQAAAASNTVVTEKGTQFLKTGLEELAARRAELYALSRNVLEQCGKKRGWGDGWESVPDVGEANVHGLEDVSLDDDDEPAKVSGKPEPALAGFQSDLLRAALEDSDDFYRLYETLTDKALRHYTVADHNHAVQACFTDLAILKYHQKDYAAAASYFYRSTPFFGERGWSSLELSMLVMYSHCLQHLQRKDEFVRVAMKLIIKAASANKTRLERAKSLKVGTKQIAADASSAAVQGFLAQLTEVTKTMPNEVPVPISQVFSDLEVGENVEYDDGRDGFTLTIRLRSLLVDEITVEQGRMCLVDSTAGVNRELLLESLGSQVLKPGDNTLRLHGKTTVAGRYDVDRLSLVCSNIHFHYERDIDQGSEGARDTFRLPHVRLYRPTGGLACQLTAAKDIQLDRNNCLDLQLSTGWNTIKSCDVRVRPNTGGLRLLTTNVEVISPAVEFARPPEAGLFHFGALASGESVLLRFPFSTEQDVSTISVKVEATYTTEDGTYIFSSTPSIPVSLDLGVNVQDVFKHTAIFSRFSVSTASPSPLVLMKSELLDSDIFESHSGFEPSDAVVVFPKQPASLLYKITRKTDVAIDSKTQKILYLKLHYAVVLDIIINHVGSALKVLVDGTDLERYVDLVTAYSQEQITSRLSPYDLERAALLGEVSTSCLVGPQLDTAFLGLGKVPQTGKDVAATLADLFRTWQSTMPRIPILSSDGAGQTRSILIPVDIPSMPILYSVDIQLEKEQSALIPSNSSDTAVGINQLLMANLHIKWTRMWNTSTATEDVQDFTYEVTAPADMWLLGGHKRGHITTHSSPGASAAASSTLDVPLMLVPLREGWVPYPTVDIREAKGEDGASAAHCETDHRNLGETVRVVADHTQVTLSLDASGPGGGPLVLETERMALDGRVIV
ncbi:hypothetical protein B0T11DRAFT_239902 [Plectosphaerella cucumerina]|uniref:Trafficking protein particle complex subunit 10 n=1 Tax=Plectosphaerella cucumerina TaxID=40658 RepID=A0A8K0X8X4_9PEZI|nr:hypothetical protein B0T11DRAFT_239902 [Plectosphaerella cucumerina]